MHADRAANTEKTNKYRNALIMKSSLQNEKPHTASLQDAGYPARIHDQDRIVF
jgi:hypothetical protein